MICFISKPVAKRRGLTASPSVAASNQEAATLKHCQSFLPQVIHPGALESYICLEMQEMEPRTEKNLAQTIHTEHTDTHTQKKPLYLPIGNNVFPVTSNHHFPTHLYMQAISLTNQSS